MVTEESRGEGFLIASYKNSNNNSLMNSQSVMNTPKYHINGRPSPSLRNWSNSNQKLNPKKYPITKAYVNVFSDKVEYSNSSNAKLENLNSYYNKNTSPNNNQDFAHMQKTIEHKTKMKILESRQC